MNAVFEKAKNDKSIEDLIDRITNLRKNIIGVLLIHNGFEFVIERSTVYRTIVLTVMLGVHESYYDLSCGTFVPLPSGYQCLNDLLNDPFLFVEWCKQFER